MPRLSFRQCGLAQDFCSEIDVTRNSYERSNSAALRFRCEALFDLGELLAELANGFFEVIEARGGQ